VCIISTTDAGASVCVEEFLQVHLSKRQGWHDAHTSFTRLVQAHACAGTRSLDASYFIGIRLAPPCPWYGHPLLNNDA
jgi:hypothetical protein